MDISKLYSLSEEELREVFNDYSKEPLKKIAKEMKLRGYSSKKKNDLIEMIIYAIEKKNQLQIKKVINSKKVDTKHIYHLADIHIRPCERIDEYRHVLNNLYDILKTKPKGVIVICGDIFHEKINNRPDGNMFGRLFFKTLSSLMPVIVFLGNHDIIQQNKNRELNLSVVLDDIPNIHFWKESGIYEFGGISYGLSSIYDDGYIPADSIEGDNIKIALYHGPIVSAITDIGFKITEDKSRFSTADFSGYDYTLLGDIHKHQYLKKNIAYPGSLIQQNFGETREEHGFIHWDLENDTSEFVEVPNDYGFVYVVIEDGVMDEVVFPKYTYLRVFNKNTEESIYNIRLDEIRSLTTILKIDEKRITSRQEIDDNDDIIKKFENFDDILKDFLIIKNPEISQDMVHNLIDTHHEYMEKNDIILDDVVCQKWKIKEITFKNFMSFGNDITHTINMDKLNGTTSITGKNASGKTTIMLLILYGLFGPNFFSKYKNKHFVNKDSTDMKITIEFSVGKNKLYKVKRGVIKQLRNGKVDYKAGKLKLIEIMDDGNQMDNSATQSGETQSRIEALIGNGKDFFTTNILSNSLSQHFMQFTSSEKMKTLTSLVNLNFCEDIRLKVIKDSKKLAFDIQKLEVEYETIQKSINDISVSDLEKTLKSKNSNLSMLSKTLTEKIDIRAVEEDKLSKQEKRKTNILKQYNKVDENANFSKKEFETLKKLKSKKYDDTPISTLSERLGELKSTLKDYKEGLEDELKKQLKYDEIFSKEHFTELEERKVEIKEEFDKIKERIKQEEKELKPIDKPNNFEECCDDITELTKTIAILNAGIIKIDKYVDDVDISSIGITRSELQLILDNCVPIDMIQKALDIVSGKVKGKGSKKIVVDTLEKVIEYNNPHKVVEIQRSISKLEVKKHEFEAQQLIIEKNQSLEKQIKDLNHRIKCSNYTKYQEQVKKIKTMKKTMKEIYSNYNSLRDEIKNKIDNNEILTRYNDLLSKKELIDELKTVEEHILYTNLKQKYDNYKENKNLFDKNKELKKLENEIDGNIHLLHSRIHTIQSSITDMEKQKSILEKEIEDLEKELVKITKIEEEQKLRFVETSELKEQYNLLDLYSSTLERKNIQKYILTKQLEYLATLVNEFLKLYTNFYIKTNINNEGSSMDFIIMKGDTELGFIQMSGMERFMINLAVKLALSNIAFKNRGELLFIDEGLDCLDSYQFSKLFGIFETLEKQYSNIFVISHIDTLGEYCNNSIKIVKEDGLSNIL